MDRPTDQRTDRRTKPLIELLCAAKKRENGEKMEGEGEGVAWRGRRKDERMGYLK